jgi:PAS domain S-box-containing protein
MGKGGTRSRKAKRSDGLRSRAEELIERQTDEIEPTASGDIQELVHELQVDQVELEIHNEELRRTQRELEEAYNKYFDLFDLAPIGYFRISDKGQIRQANLTGAELLGVERAYLEGRLFSRFVAKEDQPVFSSHLKHVLETGAAGHRELGLTAKDGARWYAFITSTPVYSREGGRREILSAVLDITEQKNLERDLKESEERFRAFCENAPDVIARFDKDLRHVYVNPAVEQVTGLPRESFIGKTNEEMGMPLQLCNQWNRILRRVFLTGKTEIGEFDFPSPGGTIWFHGRVFPEFSKTGSIQYVMTIARDITPLRSAKDDLERKVAKRTEKLVELNKSLRKSRNEAKKESRHRQYLARKLVETLEKDRREVALVLHDDLGQILTTLKMDLEAIRNSLKAIPEATAQKVKTAEEKVIKAIRGIKDISVELRPSVLDRLGLVPSIRTLSDRVKERSGIEVYLFSGDFPKRLHPELELALFRIAQEVLMNVLKHAQAGKVFLSITKKDGAVLLSIEDDGIGFDYDAVMAGDGTLGILIMKERAAMLGGEVRVESQPGKGTHVVAEIPAEGNVISEQ